jgi:hypothetical protein
MAVNSMVAWKYPVLVLVAAGAILAAFLKRRRMNRSLPGGKEGQPDQRDLFAWRIEENHADQAVPNSNSSLQGFGLQWGRDESIADR